MCKVIVLKGKINPSPSCCVYTPFRIIALIGKILGVMPLGGVLTGHIRYRFCSIITAYSIVLIVLEVIFSVGIAWHFITTFHIKLTEIFVTWLIAFSLAFGHSLAVRCFWISATAKLPKYFRSWRIVDENVPADLSGHRRWVRLYLIVGFVAVGYLVASGWYSLILISKSPKVMYDFYLLAALTTFGALIFLSVPTLSEICVIFFCRLLQQRYEVLRERIMLVLKPYYYPAFDRLLAPRQAISSIGSRDTGLSRELDDLRRYYQKLCDLVTETNRLCDPFIMLNLLINPPCICVFVYAIARDLMGKDTVKDIIQVDLIIFMIMIFILLARVFIFVIWASGIINKAEEIRDLLHRIPIFCLPQAAVIPYQVFLQTCNHLPAFTAANFFTVNRGLFTTIMSLVVTYMIVVIQFKYNDTNPPWISNGTKINQ